METDIDLKDVINKIVKVKKEKHKTNFTNNQLLTNGNKIEIYTDGSYDKKD